jgi:ribonuclease D
VTVHADISFSWVDNDRNLKDSISFIQGHHQYFLDTEFHREKTYFPQLALVQIAAGGQIFLIDPQAVTIEILNDLFHIDATCVMHAAQQDLDVLTQSVGTIPHKIFDTQLAAGFLGYTQPSLSSLTQSLLKVTVPKGDRLSDWMRRPLSEDQLQYAASDVLHLPELSRIITEQLTELGRLQWAHDACEELRRKPTGPISTENAWLRIKDVRTLKGRARWIAQSVAEWRELRAMNLDIPPRHVLSDIAILGIAQKAPRSTEDLAKSRGVDQRHLHGTHGAALLEAVRKGISAAQQGELAFPATENDDVDKSMKAAVTLVSAWISELARQTSLDSGLLATRRDIVELLLELPHARLSEGWRAEIVGRDIEDLISGRKGLTFKRSDHERGLRLVDIPHVG